MTLRRRHSLLARLDIPNLEAPMDVKSEGAIEVLSPLSASLNVMGAPTRLLSSPES